MKHEQSTIVAVFPTIELAEAAVEELLRLGYNQENVGVMLRGDDPFQSEQQAEQYGSEVVKRTTGGAVLGGVLTGLIGTAATFALPGVGTVIGVGLIAASGAIAGGFAGLMSTENMPNDDIDWYRKELETGRPLVIVRTENRYSEALSVLQIHGAYDATREKSAEESQA